MTWVPKRHEFFSLWNYLGNHRSICEAIIAKQYFFFSLCKEKGDWSLEYISKDDPQCETFKKEIEDRIRKLRQSLVDYAHD